MSETEQRRGEERIEHFQKALGPFVAATEGARMPLAFTSNCADHPIVFANDSFLKLTGYRHDEVIGQPLARVLAGDKNPKGAGLVEAQFQDSADELDLECRRKDGGRIWASLCVSPVHDENGAVVQYFASLIDLTVQMERLRRERNAVNTLYQQTPDFIAITEGPDHRFTFANAAFQQLVGDRDLLGRTLNEAFPELAGQDPVAHLDMVYQSGKPFVAAGMAVKLQRRPGADVELRYLDLVYQPVAALDGTVTGIFCEGHDVTEHKVLGARIKALEGDVNHLEKLGAMGKGAATLAHEMTQPLTAISNYTAACRHLNARDGDNRAQMAVLLDAIATAVRRSGSVIQELQYLTERRISPRDHFRLKDAISESVAVVRAAGLSSASIVDRSDEQIELDANRTQIQQVLTNLLRNSWEAMGSSGGRITVSTAMKRGKVVMSVKDTGDGISSAASEGLFRWSDSTKSNGTGIGLSICREIVEAHGGEFWLKQSGHTGACFAFSLPLQSAPEAIPSR